MIYSLTSRLEAHGTDALVQTDMPDTNLPCTDPEQVPKVPIPDVVRVFNLSTRMDFSTRMEGRVLGDKDADMVMALDAMEATITAMKNARVGGSL